MKRIALVFLLVITILVSAAMPAMATQAVVTSAETPPYSDIGGTWFEKSAAAYGYTDIFSDGSGLFNPDKEITRMEFAQMLHKALGIKIEYFAPTDIKEYYNDVQNSDPGTNQLYDLVTAGIVDFKGSFSPNSKLDREDMIHFAIGALDYMTGGEYALIKMMPAPFADDDKISESRKNDVMKAVLLKLINGSDNHMLLPKNGATRAEAVTVADRLVNLVNNLSRKVVINSFAKEIDGSLNVTLSIVNNTGKTVVIDHTSGQKFDLKLFDDKGETLYTWSADKLFSMALTKTEIKDGETLDSLIVLESGVYGPIKSKVAEIKVYITGTSEDFFLKTDGYTVKQI